MTLRIGFLVLLGWYLVSCDSRLTNDNKKVNVEDSTQIDKKQLEFGIFTNLSLTTAGNRNGIPLYREKESDLPLDSVYIVNHHNENCDFYLLIDNNKLILPQNEQYFTFFVEKKRKSGLLYETNNDSTIHILQGDYWIKKKDFPSGFKAYSWDAFLTEIDMTVQYLLPLKKKIRFYSDTSLNEARGQLKISEEAYGRNIKYSNGLLQMDCYKVIECGFTGNYNENISCDKELLAKDVFINPVVKNVPQFKLVQNPFKTNNFNLGVGIIAGPSNDHNYFFQRKRRPYEDSLMLYNTYNGEPNGFIPLFGNAWYLYEAQLLTDTSLWLHTAGENDLSAGMTSLDYIIAYEQHRKWVRILSSRMDNKPTWITLEDLYADFYSYYTWAEYFEQFPNGNKGWQKGYHWNGGLDYLYDAPNDASNKILEFPLNVAIYLIGERKGKWAKVKVNEVEHIFSNGLDGRYTGTDSIFNVWEGWIRLTNEYDYPNLEEIILGC